MKRCVVIGSGLGGLSCGVILAKNGYDVTVLEQGAQAGGCLQCFRRDGATFDTGMHYTGSLGDGEVLQTIMRYLGIYGDITFSRLDPDGYDIISLRGRHYRFANGRQGFVDALAEAFPESRTQIERYYDLMKQVALSQKMHSMSREADVDVVAAYQTRSVNEVIASTIADPTLQQVVAGIVPLYCGEKDRTPFVSHALTHDCFEQGAYRIVGGSATMVTALCRQLERHGGRVVTRQRVERIECDDTRATAITTANGQRYEADIVISTIHPADTLRLVDSRLIRPAYRKRVAGYRNTTSVFAVYLEFKKDSMPYMNHNLYYYPGGEVWGCEDYDEASWPKFLLYMHGCHEDHAQYAETGKILTYMRFDEVSQWAGTAVGHRGDDYEAFKRRKAEQLIDMLEDEVPDIRRHIESYYTSTPLTFLDYTGTPEGSMYGLAKDVNAIGLSNFSCRTGVPNLLLCGQSITFHGMFGVLAGSLITCSEVLPKGTLFAQLQSMKDAATS